jgi:hypothetical protein
MKKDGPGKGFPLSAQKSKTSTTFLLCLYLSFKEDIKLLKNKLVSNYICKKSYYNISTPSPGSLILVTIAVMKILLWLKKRKQKYKNINLTSKGNILDILPIFF